MCTSGISARALGATRCLLARPLQYYCLLTDIIIIIMFIIIIIIIIIIMFIISIIITIIIIIIIIIIISSSSMIMFSWLLWLWLVVGARQGAAGARPGAGAAISRAR